MRYVSLCQFGILARLVSSHDAMLAKGFATGASVQLVLHNKDLATGWIYPHPKACQIVIPKDGFLDGLWDAIDISFGQLCHRVTRLKLLNPEAYRKTRAAFHSVSNVRRDLNPKNSSILM